MDSAELCTVGPLARDLFIQLDFGPRASVDPTAFARSLQLDHSIQQVGGGVSASYVAAALSVLQHALLHLAPCCANSILHVLSGNSKHGNLQTPSYCMFWSACPLKPGVCGSACVGWTGVSEVAVGQGGGCLWQFTTTGKLFVLVGDVLHLTTPYDAPLSVALCHMSGWQLDMYACTWYLHKQPPVFATDNVFLCRKCVKWCRHCSRARTPM